MLVIPTPDDFSFSETTSAHGWRRLLPFVWHEPTATLERVEEMGDGAVVTLRLQDADGGVSVKVDGNADTNEMACRVRRMLQLDVPLDEFHAYCVRVPALQKIAVCRQGRMLRCPTLFEDTVRVIATTNTTWAQTIGMVARLVENFGADGRAFPGPERIAAVPFDEFAVKARFGYRAPAIYELATKIASGELDLEAWQEAGLPAGELKRRLLSLRGIGPYAAACLMLYLGKPEQVNADSWARTLVGKELGRAVSDKEVHDFFEPYGAWRGLVYTFYPWREQSGSSV